MPEHGNAIIICMLSLRHTLAALAYRATRALENAPPEFGGFSLGEAPKTPVQILSHMCDLMDWSLSLVRADQKWENSTPLPWDQELVRFFAALTALDEALAATEPDTDTERRLFQGPIADALTHTGQIAMLRRLAGCPMAGENYFVAGVRVGQTTMNQPAPHKTF